MFHSSWRQLLLLLLNTQTRRLQAVRPSESQSSHTWVCSLCSSLSSCYNHCQDTSARGDARSINQRNCVDTEISLSLLTATPATTSSSTSNYLSPDATSATITTTAVATEQTGNENAVSDVNRGLIEGQPGKSFSGLESHNDMNQSPKESLASTIREKSWIGLLGLVIGLPMAC